jgi:hypothetical protein
VSRGVNLAVTSPLPTSSFKQAFTKALITFFLGKACARSVMIVRNQIKVFIERRCLSALVFTRNRITETIFG